MGVPRCHQAKDTNAPPSLKTRPLATLNPDQLQVQQDVLHVNPDAKQGCRVSSSGTCRLVKSGAIVVGVCVGTTVAVVVVWPAVFEVLLHEGALRGIEACGTHTTYT